VWRNVLRPANVEITMESGAILANGGGVIGKGYVKGSRDRSDPSYEHTLPPGIVSAGST